MSRDSLVIEGIERRFEQGARALNVLQGASLTLAAGEVVALVGPSGSGKSSLLHIVGLLEKPDGGSVSLGGEVIDTDDEAARTALRLQHIGLSIKRIICCPSLRHRKMSPCQPDWADGRVHRPCKTQWHRLSGLG